MATALTQVEYSINVKHSGSSKTYPLTVMGKVTVEYATFKAAAALELDVDIRPQLVLVHQGRRLPKEQTIKDTLGSSTVTCCFLTTVEETPLSLSSEQIDSATIASTSGRCMGFCSDCEALAPVRPIYRCRTCKKENIILEKPFDHFEDDYDSVQGICSNCKALVKPDISYECVLAADKPHSVIFLPHIRENINDLPCMKCTEQKGLVIRFYCRHTMCLDCFGVMCKTMLDTRGFVLDKNLGYTVCCPVGNNECTNSPIADPHHFYIVDGGKKKFYREFKDKAATEFRKKDADEGDGLTCQNCKKRINLSSPRLAEVPPPVGAEPQPTNQAAGGVWSRLVRIFTRSSSTEPLKRRQIQCIGCQKLYCLECRKLWHEGNCFTVSARQEQEASMYIIDHRYAEKSIWK